MTRQSESEVTLLCRSGLKAELGAFYPLLLLRPLEAERPEPGQLYSALTALQELSAQPQLLVWSLVPLCSSNSFCMADVQVCSLAMRT